MTHHFAQSLAWSHDQADQPWWEYVYRKAFPTFQGMVCVRDNGTAQAAGIDRSITLASGRVVTVDEKVRSRDYDDFLLEFWSVYRGPGDGRNAVGWIAKDLACDYIAYAFVPSGRCYLLPQPELRRAWAAHRDEWHARYGYRDARNATYVTRSCPVPIPVVLDAIRDHMLIEWKPAPVVAGSAGEAAA